MDPALDEWHKACFVCGIKKCKRTTLSNIRFHTFPQNPEKCQLWVSKINMPKLKHLTLKQLRSRVICSNHFSDEMYINNRRLRLGATAYPDKIDVIDENKTEKESEEDFRSTCTEKTVQDASIQTSNFETTNYETPHYTTLS